MARHTESWIAEAVAGLPAVCTTDEALGVLRVSRRTLYRYIEAKKLRAFQGSSGGQWKVPRAALADFLAGLQSA